MPDSAAVAGSVQLPPDSTGKSVETVEFTRASDSKLVERQVVDIGSLSSIELRKILLNALNRQTGKDQATGRTSMSLDNIAAGLTLGTLSTVTSVTTVSTVTTVSSLSQLGGLPIRDVQITPAERMIASQRVRSRIVTS